MKIFSIVGLLIALISTVFGIIDKNLLLILSSASMSLGFVFLFYYSRDKSEKFMNLFAAFLAIYVTLNVVRLFTEKGYF